VESTTTTGSTAAIDLPQIRITLDFAESDRTVLAALEGTHDEGYGNVTVTVLQENGPAGGWPEISVSGTAPALLGWLLQHYTAGELHGMNGALYVLMS
jgi:hypothetical protein